MEPSVKKEGRATMETIAVVILIVAIAELADEIEVLLLRLRVAYRVDRRRHNRMAVRVRVVQADGWQFGADGEPYHPDSPGLPYPMDWMTLPILM